MTWYKHTYINATSINKRAAFYCLRLSWNGVQCHQLCDPTDIGAEQQMNTLEGRNTGVVRHQVELHPLTMIPSLHPLDTDVRPQGQLPRPH